MKDHRLSSEYQEMQYNFLDGWHPANRNERPKKLREPAATEHQRKIAVELGVDLGKRRAKKSKRTISPSDYLGDKVLKAARVERGDI